VFVLTHNIYFHKVVSFNRRRDPKVRLAHETFWIVNGHAAHYHMMMGTPKTVQAANQSEIPDNPNMVA